MGSVRVTFAQGGWQATCMVCDELYLEERVGVIAGRGENAYGICERDRAAIQAFRFLSDPDFKRDGDGDHRETAHLPTDL